MHHRGIGHIEFWVRSLEESLPFYRDLFACLGWKQLRDVGFSSGTHEVFFSETPHEVKGGARYGPRHICFHTESREVVEQVEALLKRYELEMIRGPQEMSSTEGSSTVDFRDPNGFVIEVAHAPNMHL